MFILKFSQTKNVLSCWQFMYTDQKVLIGENRVVYMHVHLIVICLMTCTCSDEVIVLGKLLLKQSVSYQFI